LIDGYEAFFTLFIDCYLMDDARHQQPVSIRGQAVRPMTNLSGDDHA
jgi:hypothetical protein